MNLEFGDVVELLTDKYKVSYSKGNGYYLDLLSGNNRLIFEKLDINPYVAQKKVLGYSGKGDFPCSKSLKDLNKFVNFLREEIENKSDLYKIGDLVKMDGFKYYVRKHYTKFYLSSDSGDNNITPESKVKKFPSLVELNEFILKYKNNLS